MSDPVRPPAPKDPDLFAGQAPVRTGPAPIGDNKGPVFDPAPLAELTARIKSFAAAAGEWLDLEVITTEEEAGHLADFVAGARKIEKDIEAWRVKTKEPFLEAGRSVDAAAKTSTGIINLSIKKALALSTPWQVKKDNEAKAKAAAEVAAANAKRAEAERLAREAESRNDIAGQVEAEAAIREANKEERQAERQAVGAGRVQSASGGGRTLALVDVKTAKITNIRLAFLAVQDHEGVVDAIQRALNAKIRAKDFDGKAPAGVEIVITQESR